MARFSEVNGSSRKRGRALGFSEERIFKTSTAATMWEICFVESTRPLDDESIIAACKILVKKQEALQMCIIETHMGDNESKIRFEPMKSLDKINYEAVKISHRKNWSDVLMQNRDQKWDFENGPLWRLILARIEDTSKGQEVGKSDDTKMFPFKNIFYFTIQHTIADGLSIVDAFIFQFLPILSAIMKGEEAENVIPFFPLEKTIEEYVLEPGQLQYPVPWYRRLFLDAWRWVARTFTASAEVPVTLYKFEDDSLPTVDEPDKETLYILDLFSREFTDSIILSAKKHRVSLHAVFLFANSLAMCRTAKAAGVSLPKSFKTFWPMNLRKYANFQDRQPLVFMTSLGTTNHKMIVESTSKEFWSNCSQLTRAAYFETRKGSVVNYLTLQKYQLDAAKSSDLETVRKELGRPLLGFSNLGKVPGASSEGLFRMTEGYGCVNSSGDLPLAIFVVTYDNRFQWVSVRSRYTSKRFMEYHMQEIKNILTEYCLQE